MLNKVFRITKEKEFAAINKAGRPFYASALMIKAKPNDLAVSRFAVIVSNKVSKKATQRNLIRRRIREIIRLNLTKIKTGFDLLIIVSPKIIVQGKALKQKEIQSILFDAFYKARLI